MDTPLVLAGRCAVITGAASGIGRALALDAAKRGMQVAIADVDSAGIDALAAELTAAGTKVLARKVDVSSADEVTSFADAVFAAFSSVALVFANAGLMRVDSAIRPDLKIWNQTIDVNLRGVLHTVSAFLGRMIDRGEPAQFVITSSQAAFGGGPTISAYCATKHALWGYAESLDMELKQEKSPVGASLLAPGRVWSGITMQTRERVRAADGDTDEYEKLLMPAAIAAEFTIDQAAARRFWILPADDYRDRLRARVTAITDPPTPHPKATWAGA